MNIGGNANRYGFVMNEGGGGRWKKPPPIYRMPKCKMCPHKCKPCLTLDEAEEILADESRRAWNNDTLCQMCHKKSNANQNRRTYAKAGREFGVPETDMETLERQIAELQMKLAKMGVKV